MKPTRLFAGPARRALAAVLVLGATAAHAHNPVAECKSAGPDQVQCTGGFSDGSGAPGVTLDVISYDEQILVPGKLDERSSITFKRPEGEFYVLFDAGPGHVVEIDHADIQ
ncbi:hypothetical protein V8Z80_00215 [Orrella sp. JC864]|uniref:hypothetical protein n=1 Tax=Orrella sp. JC864 TaxID=3120298 RepID=UPI0012BBA219